MPSTIPYDPSLALGNIVTQETLTNLTNISNASKESDDAKEHLNSLLSTKREVDMTSSELANAGIILNDALKNQMTALEGQIKDAAGDYVTKKIAAETAIRPLREKIHGVESSVESPIDYVKSELKMMPLSSDSISMDVQYFSTDSITQDSGTIAQQVSGFVSGSTSWMGMKASSQVTAATSRQVNEQEEKKDLTGVLVFSVSCTHKMASVFAPFILNVDKGVKVWNHLFGEADKIDLTNATGMVDLAKGVESRNKFSIISGVTFGSSFVGMVHILDSKSTTVKENLGAYASSLQAQMDRGGWFANASGGFGVNASFANDVKNLLSSQNVTSHVTFTCMGVIPTVASNEVQLGVQKFANFDPKANMDQIATIQNATNADQTSVKEAADKARTGAEMQSMRSNDIKSALAALAEVDDQKNKILDINSMMTALDDYIAKAAKGESGVPLNYYLKDITKDMLAEMWVAKYYPGQYMAIKYDDSENPNPNPRTGGGGAAGGGGGGGPST